MHPKENYISRYCRLLLLFTMLFLAVGSFSCKKHKKIDVEGTVTDVYTGQPVSGAKVKLESLIEYTSGGRVNERVYHAVTDANGKFRFNDAYFSRPQFSGTVSMDDLDRFRTITQEPIEEKDVKKGLGQAKLIRNIGAICISKLNLILNSDPNSNADVVVIYSKFEGSRSLGAFDNFRVLYSLVKYPTSPQLGPSSIPGYTDGKTILKIEFFNSNREVMRTEFDTLISPGCGIPVNYTLNIY